MHIVKVKLTDRACCSFRWFNMHRCTYNSYSICVIVDERPSEVIDPKFQTLPFQPVSVITLGERICIIVIEYCSFSHNRTTGFNFILNNIIHSSFFVVED